MYYVAADPVSRGVTGVAFVWQRPARNDLLQQHGCDTEPHPGWFGFHSVTRVLHGDVIRGPGHLPAQIVLVPSIVDNEG